MRQKEWLVRMERLRTRLEEYTGPRVTWWANDQGLIYFNLTALAYQTCPVMGPYDPDVLAEAGTDDAAHAILMAGFLKRYQKDFHEVRHGC
jgi:hypothetical protein